MKKTANFTLDSSERVLAEEIRSIADHYNKDNISRTDAYFDYYQSHQDIQWAFLASMVSRNAGWNMCDLEEDSLSCLLGPEIRERLFLTYERANWLIFSDAFPQLLLYEYSTKKNSPMFHLLPFFHVSSFMEAEWNRYWQEGDRERLMTALIINEQNLIQRPVIEHPVYKRRVFHSLFFSIQDWLHFSSVLFPTCSGRLYGASVKKFRKTDERIMLGKRLARILFSPVLFPEFLNFAGKVPHTGSRADYEQFLNGGTGRVMQTLKDTYPIISHHIHESHDWSKDRRANPDWFAEEGEIKEPVLMTEWFLHKQRQLERAAAIKKFICFKS